MESFWTRLSKPFFVLAPMADVTDPAYRRLIAEYGRPDVTWTEFVSADGLYATRERKGMPDAENPLMRDLLYTEGERPIVAQLFTSNPETMAYAAKLAAELGYDGVDINMGCPDRSIEKQGAGAAMIKNPERAKEVFRAARSSGLPTSVKTRIGYNEEIMEEWLPQILAEQPDALTVHLRTRKEMSKVPAHWDIMARAVAIRDRVSPSTKIIGNGDVLNLADAKAKLAETGADGAMLGRAIFGNPWVFTGRTAEDITPIERLEALEKLSLYYAELVPTKPFHILKKHFKAFVHGWDNAAEMRARFMDTNTQEELLTELQHAKELIG